MTIKNIDFEIEELKYMKKTPKEIFYIGNPELLRKRKVSIVGTRKPSQYTKLLTHEIASKLSKNGFVVVSGAAMGVDAVSHKAAGAQNTVAVAGTSLDIRYPSVNKRLIQDIEENGLIISMFDKSSPPRAYNFPVRNELVAALGEILIVMQADKKSGTLTSVEYALRMGKKVYVLTHRAGESPGTQELLINNKAIPIFDADHFLKNFLGKETAIYEDDFLQFCKTMPTYDEAMLKNPEKTFEYELSGKIKVENGIVLIE